MNKLLVTFAVVLALAGCAKQRIVGQPPTALTAKADAQGNFNALQAPTQTAYAAAQVQVSKESPEELQADDSEELAANLAQQKVARAFAATHTAQEVAAAWCTERGQSLNQCVMYQQYVKKAPTKAAPVAAPAKDLTCQQIGGDSYCKMEAKALAQIKASVAEIQHPHPLNEHDRQCHQLLGFLDTASSQARQVIMQNLNTRGCSIPQEAEQHVAHPAYDACVAVLQQAGANDTSHCDHLYYQ